MEGWALRRGAGVVGGEVVGAEFGRARAHALRIGFGENELALERLHGDRGIGTAVLGGVQKGRARRGVVVARWEGHGGERGAGEGKEAQSRDHCGLCEVLSSAAGFLRIDSRHADCFIVRGSSRSTLLP